MGFGPELPLNYLCPWQPAVFDTPSAVGLDVKAGIIKKCLIEGLFFSIAVKQQHKNPRCWMNSLQWIPLAREKHLGKRCSQLRALMQAILHKLGKVLALLLKSLLACRKAERRNWPPKNKASSLVRCCEEQMSYEASPILNSLLRSIPSEEYLIQKSERNHIFILFLISKAIWLTRCIPES